MKYYVDSELSKGRIAITKLVKEETLSAVWNVLSRRKPTAKITDLQVAMLVRKSTENFGKLTVSGLLDNDITFLPNVSKMYSDIWNNPQKRTKIQTWATMKHVNITDGPPGGNDLLILSTAANLAKDKQVELLTFDHDFVVFGDEIKETFGVTVINAGTIPS